MSWRKVKQDFSSLFSSILDNFSNFNTKHQVPIWKIIKKWQKKNLKKEVLCLTYLKLYRAHGNQSTIYLYRTKGTYCGYTWGTIKQTNLMTPFEGLVVLQARMSANLGRLGRACQLLSSKGVLFFNYFIVSHVATECTFGPILADLLELFFCPSNHCHELWIVWPRLMHSPRKRREEMPFYSI